VPSRYSRTAFFTLRRAVFPYFAMVFVFFEL
jgi:hypothetical protein